MNDSISEDLKDFIPNGYEKENEIVGQLCLEDLDEDSELWLIRMPSDVELSDLQKKKIYLGSDSNEINVTNIVTGNGNTLECCAENCDIPNMCVVLPDKSGKKLHAAPKVFKGAIIISEGLNINIDPQITEKVEDLTADVVSTDVASSFNFKSCKKSKKKRKSLPSIDSQNLLYETEDAEYVSQPITKHKHLKKKRNKINMRDVSGEIKSEPESTDIDGFPTCSSQV